MPEPQGRPYVAGHSAAARLLLAAMCWFIMYGSLFPFDFAASPRPLSSFLDEVDLFTNRSDAIDNFFLFVPFGAALHASFAGARARLAGAVLALLVLGAGMQLMQLYLPSRTASLSDVTWNGIGMAAGMLLATRLRVWPAAQVAEQGSGHDNYLLAMVVLWVCYESFPFVPTLDIGMLRAHIKPAIVAPPFELSRLLQHAAAAALAAICALHVGWLRRPVSGVALLGALVLALEVCVPYGALRRETMLGIMLGLAAGLVLARPGLRRAAALALPLSLAMVLFTVMTPYRGQWPDASFSWVPFSHFLRYSSLGVLPPLAFEALAIGCLLWSGLRLGRGPALSWCLLVFLLLGFLEALRVAVVGVQGDTTTLLLALVLGPWAAVLHSVRQRVT